MDVPDIVRERLGDERRLTSVNVGGDDRVYVTPPRTLVYHASGLFSRESIDEYSHDARRFDVSASRREATFAFEYDDGVEAFSIPRQRIETVLPPVLAGVLRTTGHIENDESVEESYRFGERTVVVTESRVLTSVGEAVWDHDHDSYGYENATDVAFDDGDLVVVVDGRSRRIELDDDSGYEAYQTVEQALLAYHGVASVDELGSRPAETPRSADEASGMGGFSSAGSLGSSTGTASPDPTDREPTSNRPDETESATPSSPSETADQEGSSVGSERAGVAPDDEERDPVSTASVPPSSPAPGGPPADPLIPEAPEAGEPVETNDPTGASGDAEPPSETGPETNVETPTDAPPTADAPTDATASTDTDAADATPDLTAELDALRERVDRQHRLLERNQELLERLVETQERRRVSDDP